jgi:hypothetical protein
MNKADFDIVAFPCGERRAVDLAVVPLTDWSAAT